MLSVALIFFSCEDENSIIGYPNPNKKFKVNQVVIPLETSVVLLDSVITDNKSVRAGTSLIGRYQDNVLGPVTATSYLQLVPAFSSQVVADAELDSVVLNVRANFYSYGLTDSHVERFTVHSITGDTLNRLSNHSYYYNSTVEYDPTPIGNGAIKVDYEDFKTEFALPLREQDTLVARAKLSDDFGNYLLGLIKANGFSTEAERARFINDVKGLTLVPTESSAVIGYQIFVDAEFSSVSNVTLYYHTSTDTTAALFVFNPASFTNISADRSATELAGALPYQSVDPASGDRYVESGSPVVTKVDLTNLYDFLNSDTIDNIVINEAEFLIEGVESPVALPAHSTLRFRYMKENNLLMTSRVAADAQVALKYHSIPDGAYFGVQADNPSELNPFSLIGYETKEKAYSGYMTLFAQTVFANRDSGDQLRYLALFPHAPSMTRAVNRTVFHKDNIKLKISYTRALN